MMRLRNDPVVRILKALEEKGRLYTKQIASAVGVDPRNLEPYLPILREDRLAKMELVANKRYYEITNRGRRIIWPIYHPDEAMPRTLIEPSVEERRLSTRGETPISLGQARGEGLEFSPITASPLTDERSKRKKIAKSKN